MTIKIVEVLTQILDGMNRDIPIEKINHDLSGKPDIDQATLSVAYSLLYDHFISVDKPLKKGKKPNRKNRILNNQENDALGAENYNYLLHLLNVGMIDEYTFESILEQASIIPGEKITKDDIDWMILISLLEIDSGILPGSRVLLYSSDVIN